jgi:Tropinone reductase 1
MGTNFESSYHLSQLAHPLFKESGYGSIVFLSSVLGLRPVPFSSIYAASKGMFYFNEFFNVCKFALVNWDITLHISYTIYIISIVYMKLMYIGAINQCTKNLALEWAKDNIRANVVVPGAVNTAMLEFILV